jgi:hypothetical protein
LAVPSATSPGSWPMWRTSGTGYTPSSTFKLAHCSQEIIYTEDAWSWLTDIFSEVTDFLKWSTRVNARKLYARNFCGNKHAQRIIFKWS